MANSTPSSILNELAKCNKVTAHYQVVKEAGPAHQKVYNVHLHIGGHGPFEGVGSSLKAARNAAASRALIEGAPGLHINPTVELNILSMKSGEIANYRELDSVSLPPRQNEYESLFTSHQTYSSIQQPLHRRPPPRTRRLWRMSVTICQRTYIGEGHTKSEARGNAASHALLELKGHLIEKAKIIEIERVQQQQAVLQLNGVDQTTAAIKPPSAVSKVHEIANRNKHAISFETVNENGPAHVKMFYIKCKVGNTEVLGQGVGKKAAKNDAAEKMLVRLKDVTPISDVSKDMNGKKSSRSRNSGRPSSQKPRNESGLNPKLDAVTYLTQLMQLRKENAPVYTLKADAGPQQKAQYGRVRYQIQNTFHIQVSIGEFNAVGYGENKKIAKANAASNLLTLIGMNLDELRRKQEEELKNKASPTSHLNQAIDALHKKPLNRAPGSPLGYANTLTIKQRLEQHEIKNLTCKKKLEYIARTEGFQVLYNDFIKSSNDEKIEYASHLALLTSKPLVFQGSAATVDRAREDAARKALESLINNPLETSA